MVHESIKDVNISEGFDTTLSYVNRVTESWISRTILIGIFVIVTLGVYKYKKDMFEALAIGGLSTFIIAFLFWVTNFIDTVSFMISIAVAVLFFGMLWFSNKSPN